MTAARARAAQNNAYAHGDSHAPSGSRRPQTGNNRRTTRFASNPRDDGYPGQPLVPVPSFKNKHWQPHLGPSRPSQQHPSIGNEGDSASETRPFRPHVNLPANPPPPPPPPRNLGDRFRSRDKAPPVTRPQRGHYEKPQVNDPEEEEMRSTRAQIRTERAGTGHDMRSVRLEQTWGPHGPDRTSYPPGGMSYPPGGMAYTMPTVMTCPPHSLQSPSIPPMYYSQYNYGPWGPPSPPPHPPATEPPPEEKPDPEKEAMREQLILLEALQKEEEEKERRDKIREEAKKSFQLEMEQAKKMIVEQMEEEKAVEMRGIMDVAKKEIEEAQKEATRAAQETREAERALDAAWAAVTAGEKARLELDLRNKIKAEMKAEEDEKGRKASELRRLEMELRGKIRAENAEAGGGWDSQLATMTQKKMQRGMEEILMLAKKKLLQEMGARKLASAESFMAKEAEARLPSASPGSSRSRTTISSNATSSRHTRYSQGGSGPPTISVISDSTPPDRGPPPGKPPSVPDPPDANLGADKRNDDGDKSSGYAASSVPLHPFHPDYDHGQHFNHGQNYNHEHEGQPGLGFRGSKEYEMICMIREALLGPISAMMSSHMKDRSRDGGSHLSRQHEPYQRPFSSSPSGFMAPGSTGVETPQHTEDEDCGSFISDPAFNCTGPPNIDHIIDQSGLHHNNNGSELFYEAIEGGGRSTTSTSTTSTLSHRTEAAIDSILSTTRHNLTSTGLTDFEQEDSSDAIMGWVFGPNFDPWKKSTATKARRATVKTVQNSTIDASEGCIMEEEEGNTEFFVPEAEASYVMKKEEEDAISNNVLLESGTTVGKASAGESESEEDAYSISTSSSEDAGATTKIVATGPPPPPPRPRRGLGDLSRFLIPSLTQISNAGGGGGSTSAGEGRGRREDPLPLLQTAPTPPGIPFAAPNSHIHVPAYSFTSSSLSAPTTTYAATAEGAAAAAAAEEDYDEDSDDGLEFTDAYETLTEADAE